MPVTASFKLEFLLAAGWTDVTADVRHNPPPTGRYGIFGTGPTDRVADIGTFTFALDNGQGNSAGLLGYYSPGHADARAGFDLGIEARASFTYSGSTFYKFRGTLDDILPVPGKHGARLTHCTVVDWIDEAARHKLRLISTQVDKRGNQLIDTVVATMERKPSASTLATGQDVFPFAFDNEHDETTTPLGVFQTIAQSELGQVYVKGNTSGGGELVFEDRHARPKSGSALATLDDDMVHLTPRRSRYQILNRINAIVHPRRTDAGAVTLFTLQSTPLIEAAATATFQAGYVDPTGGAIRIGALTACTLVANTDYTMNSASDGSGTDLTSDFTIAASFGGNSVRFSLTAGVDAGYVTLLQMRGRGLYDYEPVTLEASDAVSASAYGENVLPLDMPLQTSVGVGRDAADYMLQVWKDPLTRVDAVRFVANESDALMLAALRREISDRIALVETVTGIDRDYYINGIEWRVLPKDKLEFAWTVVPTDPFASWIIGVVGSSEIGETTRVGY